MSLINDALRRANPKAGNPEPSVGLGVPLQPVEYRRRQSSWLYLLAGPLAFGLFGLAAWLLWSAATSTPKTKPLLDTLGNQALSRDAGAAQDKPVPLAKPAPLIEPAMPK